MAKDLKPAVAPASVQAEARFLFQTPVAVARVEGADVLVAELKETILAKKAADKGIRRSNEGGWHSDDDMLTWGGPAARKLAEAAIALAQKMSFFADGTSDDYDWCVGMWANVSSRGALNHLHVHGGNLWAAVFYIELGRDLAGADGGGDLYFEDPRFPLVAMKSPSFRLTGPDGKPQNSQVRMKPNQGDLLLFPAWLRHGVHVYSGNAERISVAINLDVTERSAAATRLRRDAAKALREAKAAET